LLIFHRFQRQITVALQMTGGNPVEEITDEASIIAVQGE